MKKYLSLIFVLTFFIIGIGEVKADDGGPNSVFWMKGNKVTCVSVLDPENIAPGSFFVFDYSPSIGQSRGKPWTIIEKGKCYQLDKDGGSIYSVKIINGNERQQFANYSAYKPTDEIPEIFCVNPYYCEYADPVSSIDIFGYQSVTLDYGDIVFDNGIRANEVFPTKYDLGDPITSYTSTPSQGPVFSDLSFIQAGALYETLAEDLQNKLQSCDTRMRVEYQATVDPADNQYLLLKNLVWRLSDNKDISFNPPEVDQFQAIELMGCRATFREYIQSHQGDFTNLDRLTDQVVQKYPSAVGDDYDQPLKKRDPSDISKILLFATTSEAISYAPTGTPVSGISFGIPITQTVLDEPTPEEKTDMLVNSPNPLVRVYAWFPIVALACMLVFLFLKKRSK